ncbi:serine protease, partial [Micromonospora sp. CV4]
PDADLYAIKVFGAKGSTSDEVVIAALEYAADPTGDLTFQKQLDVVNLSLGSGYGNPHIMYNHAIKNLVRGGTVVVAAAGNSGDLPYIVGAPSVSDDAISVANSIDNMNQNVLFPAAEFAVNGEALIVEATEGAITKPLADVTDLKAE